MARARAGYPARLAHWGPAFAGIAVAFPSFLLPGVASGAGPRTTDLMNLISAGLILLAVRRTAMLHRTIYLLLLVWALSLPWALVQICALAGNPDPPVQRIVARWILCSGSAYLIVTLLERPMFRARFFVGLGAGLLLSFLSVVYDYLTFSPEDMPVEELVKLAIYNGKDIHDFVYRAYGIFGHPNGAAGCLLIGVPVLIGAIEERWAPRYSMVIGLALMAGVFYFTKSRGPLLVSTALIAYWLWTLSNGARLMLVVAAVAAMLGLLAAGGLTMGGDQNVLLARFFDADSISVNAGDRWWTIATSFDLLLHHPFGMGSGYVEPLETATGTNATHNAYTELALMGGIPLTVFVTARLGCLSSRLLTPWRPVEAWLAAYLLGIFAFESYFLQVNILLITLWLTVTPLPFRWRPADSAARSLRPPTSDITAPAVRGVSA